MLYGREVTAVTEAPERRKKQKTGKRRPVWVLAVLDLLMTGVILCVFALFHHVIPWMAQDMAGPPEPVADLRPAESTPAPVTPEPSSSPVYAALRRAQAAADFVRRQSRSFTVTLPDSPQAEPGLTARQLDRAVERDARRYDGGFSLY